VSKLAAAKNIWVLQGRKEDFLEGARYALISLPWTFNRMSKDTGSYGQRQRALNIAKGIVAQEILRRALGGKGIKTEVQRKSHRDEDFFDFRVRLDGAASKLDLKTWNFFTDYTAMGREPLSSQLIIENASSPGPDWRRFFPMLVPHTQIEQSKESYCFAAASSIDFRRDVSTNRAAEVLASFPYGEYLPFLSSKRLCLERESCNKGFYLTFKWQPRGMYDKDTMTLDVIGEWAGKNCIVPAVMRAGKDTVVGPFSCVASFRVAPDEYHQWADGTVTMSVRRNEFTKPVLVKSTGRDVNQQPAGCCQFGKDDFCNLVLPNDYTVFFVGWMTKDDFLAGCRKYPAWVWPLNEINKYENTPWSQITAADRKNIERAGFGDCIRAKPSALCAGWLKTTGKGGGACCYFYPNIGRMGGVKETNLYVLPQDLYSMESLG